MTIKPKLIIIVGPTSSGKSDLAVNISKKFKGEIISADSRQIYRDLNIGTGKVPGKWKNGVFIYKSIPHYLIDEINPKKTFSVAEYKNKAQKTIKNIIRHAKLPILAGGTGFWIDAVIYNFKFPEVLPNKKLRKYLSKKSPDKLLKILKTLDPQRAKTIEQKNPRRLIRAIEIAKTLGSVPHLKKHSLYKPLWLGIKTSKNELKTKIHKRLISRIRSGMIEESKKLRRRGLNWRRFYELGLEYKFLADYLRKKITKKQMVESLERAIYNYAGRQMTWFKKNKKIGWVKSRKEAEKLVARHLRLKRI